MVVFDPFVGIGGLPRALDRAGVTFRAMVSVEKDKACQRLLTAETLETEVRKHPNVSGIIAGGGSPFQGLSKLSCERQGLELFFVLADRLAELERLAKARGLWFIGFVENVVCDDADRGRMAPWRRPTLGYLQVGHGPESAGSRFATFT